MKPASCPLRPCFLLRHAPSRCVEPPQCRLVLCHSPSSGAEPRSVSACVHCVALHLLSVLCLASSSTLTGPRGGTTLSVGLRPLCRSTPASGPQHYSVTHRTAGPGSSQCRLAPELSICACLWLASSFVASRASGQIALSVCLRPLCRCAPVSGPLQQMSRSPSRHGRQPLARGERPNGQLGR